MLENGAKSRKRLGAKEKFEVFIETCRGDVPIAQVLRKHGLYFSDLKRIREKVERGALKELSTRFQGNNGSGEVSQAAYESLKAEKERQEKALIELSIENTLLKKSSVEPERAHPGREVIAPDKVGSNKGNQEGCRERHELG